MTILCIDGMNFAHRARGGWSMGPAPVVFNFMRNFRSLVQQFSPSRVYFVLEGKPQQRIDALPEYKANRVIEPGSEKESEMKKFFEQVGVVVDIMSRRFPVSVVRHPRYECDDVIYNLVRNSSKTAEWVIASNDSDFTQLLNEFDNVKLYNPMLKKFVEKPDYHYVAWKSLRGDASDNIPGIVSDGVATKMVNDPDLLREFFANSDNMVQFNKNFGLIKFIEWVEGEAEQMTCSSPERGWEDVKQLFDGYGFKSLTKDGSWDKFVGTFDKLWG